MEKTNNKTNFLKLFVRNRAAVIGLTLLTIIILLALLAPLIFPENPFKTVGKPLLEPFGEFVLGTSIGSLSGYYGGQVDNLLMRFTEFFQTIPSFVFAIVLVAILQPSIQSIVIAITVVTWPPVARLVRGEFIAMRNREFVEACICLGMKDSAIIFREILPNVLSPILVTGSLMTATAILIESALAFLGLGDPNVMSWGFMIGSGREFLRTAWWLCAIPGIAILITVLGINLVGEGLNDTFNPKLRNL